MNHQIELNQALLDAIEAGDLTKAEELLKRGADPLGSIDESDPNALLLSEVFFDMAENGEGAERFSDFLWLFCKYGIDVAATTFPETECHEVPPMCELALSQKEGGLKILHALLEYGLNPDSAEVLVDCIFRDIAMSDGCEVGDSEFMQTTVCGLQMIMLVASYPSVLKKSTHLQEVIELEKNDRHKLAAFRNWNDFAYRIDLSTCTNIPHGLRDATLTIRDRKSGERVWTMSI